MVKKTVKKNSRKTLYNILILLFAVIFVVSAVFILKDIIPRIRNMRQIDEIRNVSPFGDLNNEGSGDIFDIENISFDELKQINSDIKAWIYIEGTNVNHPVLQGPDNEYYLYVSYLNEYSGAGSIYLDAGNSDDFTDQNTVVYGHAMIDKTMFGTLSRYRDQSFYDSYPYIHIVTDEGIIYCYKIFAVNIIGASYDYRSPEYGSDFDSFISYLRANSIITSDTSVTDEDKIITLSTCTDVSDEARLAVFGVLINPNGERVDL